ncbi:DoxX family protein [Burkholderia sp. Bp8963]|uniref:DoxX family protein n=1 Tax=Burkholderia sp. Bp8963 TaxID=2184547 RepID=UPI000F59BA1B|nr:DoxX family protein [Burkholderia sp. Bp8963]RQS56349.1 DoxX family protein [Burkholderia sp. Bp8963]
MNQPIRTSDTAATYGALLLRVALGVMWIAHALLKWLVFTLPGTAQYFDNVGFPGFLAYPVFAAELAGGLALVLGVYARQVALLLVPIMVCAARVHWSNGWVHTSQGGGWEYPAFLVVASVSLWLLGDGALAVRRSPRFALGAA